MPENCDLDNCQILYGFNVTAVVLWGDRLVAFPNDKKKKKSFRLSIKAILYAAIAKLYPLIRLYHNSKGPAKVQKKLQRKNEFK